jgi:cyclase
MWLRHPNTPAFLTAPIGCFSEDDPAAPGPAWATKIHGLMTAITPLHPGPVRFEGGLTEVGPGLHAWLQPNGLLGESNAGLVVGDGASLLVDTLWDPRLTRRMLAAMAPLIEKAPIETLVNTHSDGDHWWGNQEVPTTEIIATESARAVMEAESPAEIKRFGALAAALRFAGSMPFLYPRRDAIAAIAAYVSEALAPFSFDEVRLAPPTRTFSGQLELDVGGRKVTLIEVGPAHTPGDLIVWVPDAKVAFAADILFIGVTPIMWAGPLEGWIAALERLLGLDAEWFVPGHGPVCGPDEVGHLIDYWRWLDEAAGQRLNASASPAEAARELVLGEEIAERGFADWLAPERVLVSVGTIDAHRRGDAKLPGPRELIAAFFRMALLARDYEAQRDPRQTRREERSSETERT